MRESVSLLGLKQRLQLKDAFQADETVLYEFSLEAIALQKESFLQVLNKALLFKHKLTAINVQETLSRNMQVSVSCRPMQRTSFRRACLQR